MDIECEKCKEGKKKSNKHANNCKHIGAHLNYAQTVAPKLY